MVVKHSIFLALGKACWTIRYLFNKSAVDVVLRLWYHNNNYYEFDHLSEINLGKGKVTNDGDKKTQILQLNN